MTPAEPPGEEAAGPRDADAVEAPGEDRVEAPGADGAEAPGADGAEAPTDTSVELPGDQLVVLFDGVCNLCSWWVRFIVPRDESGTLRFAPLQSDVGERLLADCGYEVDDRESIVLVEEGDCSRKSTAALRIAAHMDGPWPLARYLRVVPRVLRDAVYDLVARYRYAVFGRKEQCMVPDQDVRDRFLAMSDAGDLADPDATGGADGAGEEGAPSPDPGAGSPGRTD